MSASFLQAFSMVFTTDVMIAMIASAIYGMVIGAFRASRRQWPPPCLSL